VNINWNPTYSPVWRWLRDHGLALLGMVAVNPDMFGAAAEHAAMVAGVATALGAVGKHYAKEPGR
jgi:hypothetical protein